MNALFDLLESVRGVLKKRIVNSSDDVVFSQLFVEETDDAQPLKKANVLVFRSLKILFQDSENLHVVFFTCHVFSYFVYLSGNHSKSSNGFSVDVAPDGS
jgi:hypothetical protein